MMVDQSTRGSLVAVARNELESYGWGQPARDGPVPFLYLAGMH